MPKTVLTISSKNYGAWSLRGWLMCKLAGLSFEEHVIPPDDPSMTVSYTHLDVYKRQVVELHDTLH